MTSRSTKLFLAKTRLSSLVMSVSRGRLSGSPESIAFLLFSIRLPPQEATAQASQPPALWPLYALLSPWSIGAGLALTLLVLDRLRRFSRLFDGVQFPS